MGGLCGIFNATARRLQAVCGGGSGPGGSGDNSLQETLAPLVNVTTRLQQEQRPEATAAAQLLLEATEVLVLEAATHRAELTLQTFSTDAMSAGAVAFIAYRELEAALDVGPAPAPTRFSGPGEGGSHGGSLQESFALELVTCVGLSLSVLGLVLAIGTFLLCRSLWNVSVALHLQLSICLLMADVLFLAAMRPVRNPLACAIVAGLLHYLFLACFTWMFLEGLHLFLTVRNLRVVNYTSASRFRKRYIYPAGYGLPALVVAISIAINPGGYGTSKHCWLTTKGGFVWSFVGPVCAIILVNLVFYLTTLWILQEKLSTLNKDVSSLKSTRTLTFKALAQVFILGCTWGLGLLQTRSGTPVMAFLFTGLNSLQGVFIYVVHCLLNRQVTEQYLKWLRALRPKAESTEVTMTSMNITSVTEQLISLHFSEESAHFQQQFQDFLEE
ncbi:PREDICTED: EGF-like module-containing mucin-like hormone receptor-like 1 [Tinamus guttatus]|uniref:EGF-like module-containing mucin-like hormone receptor-like 1 n=1 Tax=Tinamus guttatus TaxID=94827 RepID=UPI00052E6FB8|nr:PREDICTED: EGF-like module-containing mucin-like hormone receptor-like 1 [Tinamus guttatus]